MIVEWVALAIVLVAIFAGTARLRRHTERHIPTDENGRPVHPSGISWPIQSWIVGLAAAAVPALLITGFAITTGDPGMILPVVLVWSIMLLLCWAAWKNVAQRSD
jgi:hypothetical protein